MEHGYSPNTLGQKMPCSMWNIVEEIELEVEEDYTVSGELLSTISRLAEFDEIDWDYQKVPIDLIDIGHWQPRKNFDSGEIEELGRSMLATGGNSQTVTLRPKENGRFELVAGERRWRAAQVACIPFLNSLVSNLSDRLAMIIALVENVQRKDLNPIEESEAFQRMAEEGGLTHLDIAAASGKSRTYVTNTIRLSGLDIGVKDLLRSGKLSSGHGKVLAGLDDRGAQRALAKLSVKHRWTTRQIEVEVAKAKTGEIRELAPTKDKDIARLEEQISERLGFPCSISTQTNGKVQMTIRFANNQNFYDFLEQQNLSED